MILGFAHKQNKKAIHNNSFRAVLKYAWYPKKVQNDSLPAKPNNFDNHTQWIWLEFYSVIEIFNIETVKWKQDKTKPFIYPTDEFKKQVYDPIRQHLNYTDPSFFIYWRMMTEANEKRKNGRSDKLDTPYKTEPILNVNDSTVTYQGT